MDAFLEFVKAPFRLLELLHLDPLEALLKMGFTAAQIIGAIIGEEVPDVAAIGSADDVPERGFEIGITLGETRDITRGRGGPVPRIELPYSIMALCEVWTEDSNQRLMSMLTNTGRPYALYSGPGKTSKSLGGSGLVQIIGGFEVLSTEEVGYGSRGRPIRRR